jgi:hypothetical protein
MLDYFCPLLEVALISCSLLEAARKYALLLGAAWTSPADWGLPGLLLGLPDNSSCCLVVFLVALCSVQSTRWLLAAYGLLFPVVVDFMNLSPPFSSFEPALFFAGGGLLHGLAVELPYLMAGYNNGLLFHSSFAVVPQFMTTRPLQHQHLCACLNSHPRDLCNNLLAPEPTLPHTCYLTQPTDPHPNSCMIVCSTPALYNPSLQPTIRTGLLYSSAIVRCTYSCDGCTVRTTTVWYISLLPFFLISSF